MSGTPNPLANSEPHTALNNSILTRAAVTGYLVVCWAVALPRRLEPFLPSKASPGHLLKYRSMEGAETSTQGSPPAAVHGVSPERRGRGRQGQHTRRRRREATWPRLCGRFHNESPAGCYPHHSLAHRSPSLVVLPSPGTSWSR